MSYPKTREEWWKSLTDNQADLVSLIVGFYPIGSKSSDDWEITAQGAEKACEVIRAEIAAENRIKNPKEEFLAAVAKRDTVTILEILNGTWFGLPESVSVRDLSGFNALCDLCSESYLVERENMPDKKLTRYDIERADDNAADIRRTYLQQNGWEMNDPDLQLGNLELWLHSADGKLFDKVYELGLEDAVNLQIAAESEAEMGGDDPPLGLSGDESFDDDDAA